jgi:hypothetical protein
MIPKRRLGNLYSGAGSYAPDSCRKVFSQAGGGVAWSMLEGLMKGKTHV